MEKLDGWKVTNDVDAVQALEAVIVYLRPGAQNLERRHIMALLQAAKAHRTLAAGIPSQPKLRLVKGRA